MRLSLPLVIALAGCGPKVSPGPVSFDEDLPRTAPAAPVSEVAKPRPVAPPGKGARTGTIARDRLISILNAGPGTFLRQVEVAPKLEGERFIGWQLVQLVDQASPLYDVDLVPGDVLLALNGNPISRPDQLQTVWDSLRTANEVTAKLWRGDNQLTLAFVIEPKL
ncbi:MAG: PDZ domain-containing protein [Kofleriaceae bacterium]